MSYTFANFPTVLQHALETGQVPAAGGTTLPLDANVSADEALTLYSAVRDLRPTVSAEVGLAKGVSTLAILQALADNGMGAHHVMDPFQKNFGYSGIEMVNQAGLGAHFTFYENFAEEIIPTLPEIQFAFIDASHLYDLTLMEFILADKKLCVGGVVGFHDTWMPSLQKVLRYILSNRSYRIYPNMQIPPHPVRKATVKTRVRQTLSQAMNKLPRSEQIFSPEFLQPWSSFGIPNLVLIEKMHDDTRDWRFHRPF